MENVNGIAQVQGVLKYNEDTRSTMMARNFWKDKIYTDLGTGIGKYCEIKTAEINPVFSLDGIANAEYLSLMSINNYANHDRHLDEKYITPSISHIYGSNPQISGNIGYWNVWGGNTVAYNPEHGRIPDALFADEIKIIHDYAESKDNNGLYYLDRVIDTAVKLGEGQKRENYKPKYDFRVNKYVQAVRTDDDKNFLPFTSNFESTVNGNSRFIYNEADMANSSNSSQINAENKEYIYKDNIDEGQNNLLTKTRELFNQHKIATMIGRFNNGDTEVSEIDTAKDPKYGNSHGKNLLKLDADNDITNGYSNPYCRTWTYHHQYDRVSKLIRPFTDKDGNLANLEDIQKINKNFRARFASNEKIDDGGIYLAKNTVLNKNGFVNITPSNSGNVDIKKCMFSIENLAWKDVPKNMHYLTEEQKGPNGGRIMWFPPYDLDFQESVDVSWDSNAFIGRGEKVYTYNNTDRTGTLTFTLLIDYPSVINNTRNAKGMGNEKNVEADILRYFAGCQIPEWIQDFDEEEDEEMQANAESISIVPTEESEKIKFYVYFPNNYSGNFWEIKKNEWEREGTHESDWYNYLLMGHGTSFKEDENTWRGYEIGNGEGKGLGNAGSESFYPNKPFADGKCAQWVKREEEYKDGGVKYNYRTDFDLRQVLKNNDNYIDSASYGLNCKLDESISKDANYSFAEVMCALLLYKKDENAEKLKNFLINNGADAARINKLSTLFNQGINISKFEVKGSTTKQDSNTRLACLKEGEENDGFNGSNSKMLAQRRAKTIGMLFKNAFNIDTEKYNDKEIIKNDNLVNENLVNTKEAKSQRYAVVEIYYNAAKSEKLSDTNQAKSYSNLTESEPKNDIMLEAFCQVYEIDYNATDYFLKTIGYDYATDIDGDDDKSSALIMLIKFAEEANPQNPSSSIQYIMGNDILVDVLEYLDMREEYQEELNKIKSEIIDYSIKKEYEKALSIEDDLGLEEEIEKDMEDIDKEIEKENKRYIKDTMITISDENPQMRRYESEGEYFDKLDKESPLIFKKLVEKFKYFNPAYHSISPEGFNARLNFLQQCTRQGHTIEASDRNGFAQSAGNLAFGRMPVCVLRIGDFINTKIIIRSMSINYGANGIQWDLNPEGAGVQPMYAKVSLTITILGGQSLNGPISRLQNAVSFNYYANTGVYDNRADRLLENNPIKYDYIWGPYSNNN